MSIAPFSEDSASTTLHAVFLHLPWFLGKWRAGLRQLIKISNIHILACIRWRCKFALQTLKTVTSRKVSIFTFLQCFFLKKRFQDYWTKHPSWRPDWTNRQVSDFEDVSQRCVNMQGCWCMCGWVRLDLNIYGTYENTNLISTSSEKNSDTRKLNVKRKSQMRMVRE